jgi:predicted DNA-binding transcriptional regulator YafY
MIIDQLKVAIENKKKIQIVYEDSLRIIDPYLVGINQKDHTLLRAFQTGGFSSSGKLPSWRLFSIDKITEVIPLDESFTINELYNPNDKQMRKILFRLEKD